MNSLGIGQDARKFWVKLELQLSVFCPDPIMTQFRSFLANFVNVAGLKIWFSIFGISKHVQYQVAYTLIATSKNFPDSIDYTQILGCKRLLHHGVRGIHGSDYILDIVGEP